MLSYMLPVEEKPPPCPSHLQLSLSKNGTVTTTVSSGYSNARSNTTPLGNGTTPISKETSVSSFVSDGTTATASHSSMTPTSTSTDRGGKPKLMINGGKHQSLKRVSFGSSKGSMVETLIFESPVQEESEPSPIPENGNPFSDDSEQIESEREKVRVTFFQQSKPLEVDLPDETVIFSDSEFMMSSPITKNETNHIVYNRTESTESGWDNPFRPGGDLSREADQIVELIKGGKPITPTPGSQAPPLPSHEDQSDAAVTHNETPALKKTQPASQATPRTNGTAKTENSVPGGPDGAVNVTRGTVKPDGDASQVEHVIIKKKPKCQCCVIQ